MRISDWSSDVCSSDLIIQLPSDFSETKAVPAVPPKYVLDCLRLLVGPSDINNPMAVQRFRLAALQFLNRLVILVDEHSVEPIPSRPADLVADLCLQELGMDDLSGQFPARSEEQTSELQSLMRISYAVFCLKKKNTHRPYK